MILSSYIFTVVAGFITVLTVLIFFPEHSSYFVREDSFLESLGAILFLSSAVFACVVLLKYKQIEEKVLLAFLAISGLVFFLDEISFGRNLVKYEALRFKGMKIDAVHDLVEIAFVLAIRNPFITREMVIMFVLLLTILMGYMFRRFLTRVLFGKTGPFIWTIGLFFLISVFVDVYVAHFTKMTKLYVGIEEFFEAAAALGMVFLCFHLFWQHRNGRKKGLAEKPINGIK